MNLLPEIKNRISCASFVPGEIPEEVLNTILEAGRLAPSAKNRQPWRFIVLKNNEKKEQIKACAYGDERFGKAAVIIAACTTNIDYKMPNGELSYPMDLSFAVSQMMLQAEHEGFGSTIITTYKQEAVKNILTIPHSMKVVMMLLIGKKPPSENPKKRLSSRRVISFDHW